MNNNALKKARQIPIDILRMDRAIADLNREYSNLKRQELIAAMDAETAIAADQSLKNEAARKARKWELTRNDSREEAIARIVYELAKLNAQRDYSRRALRLLEIEAQQQQALEPLLPKI